MNIGKNDFADKLFEAFASTSKSRYIFLWNVKNDVSRWSQNAVAFFGMPDEYMKDAQSFFAKRIHPDDAIGYAEDMAAIFSGVSQSHELEFRIKDRDDNYVVCTCRGTVITGDDGEPEYYAGTITNHGIIDNIDPTTNSYNLYEFFRAIQKLRAYKKCATIMMIGFKRFSEINDVYGYTFGNEVMKTFCSLLMDKIARRGTVFRMDGSKFAVITNQIDLEELQAIYDEMQTYAQKKLKVGNHAVNITLCGSVTFFNDFEIDEHAIYASARYALDKSKNEKQGELVVIKDSSMMNNRKTVEVISALRNSVQDDCDGFYLCYQPVVSSGNGNLVGMEALLRWNKEPYGEVPPGVFIPWIENDRIFFDLGNWILKTAMTEAKGLLKDYPEFVLHVNLSYTQLERSDFRNALIDILETTGFPPQNLCLELTERCRLLDISFLRNEVIFLKSYGIKIALDDFGTGFSALNLLRELPVDCIKIDRGFVKDIESSQTDQSIVGAVTNCAKELDIRVCVEGIENEQLRDYMKKYHATSYQGYYYSKPVPLAKFIELPIYKSIC